MQQTRESKRKVEFVYVYVGAKMWAAVGNKFTTDLLPRAKTTPA